MITEYILEQAQKEVEREAHIQKQIAKMQEDIKAINRGMYWTGFNHGRFYQRSFR